MFEKFENIDFDIPINLYNNQWMSITKEQGSIYERLSRMNVKDGYVKPSVINPGG